MIEGILFVLLAWVMLGIAAAEAARLVPSWRRGRRARVSWISGIAALPKRYLVDVHHVVARKPAAARMHMLIAGGLLAGTALLLVGVIPALRHAGLYWGIVALAFAVSCAGAVLVARRRLPSRPAHLSGGAFSRLPLWLGLYALGGLLGAIGVIAQVGLLAAIGLILATIGGIALVSGLIRGPMRHALAGALHLIAHPRPGRFAGETASGLEPIALDDPDALGIAKVEDFAWNRLVGFDACIQCGRCEEACPAFAAGQPLNPKALIQDLVRAIRPDETPAYAGSAHPGLGAAAQGDAPLLLGTIRPETIWSCTTCRACVAACPMMIEHVDAIVGMRRHQTLAEGGLPGKAESVLTESRYASNPGGYALADRLDFAAGRDVRVLGEGETTDVLLWLGDGAFDRRYGRTLLALIDILRQAGVDFAVLGAAERDCGDVARRLGDEATFAELAKANIATLNARRFRRIVTADPHALHVLRNEYPAYGGTYRVEHHTAVIDALLAEGRIALGAAGAVPITYHDPCYLGRYNGEIEAPRRILARLTGQAVEMARHGAASFCCGGGGAAPVTDIPGEHRIPDLRMEQAKATGASVVAVACPGCTAMLEGVIGERPEVRDIAELVRDAMQQSTADAPARVAEPA